MVWSIKKKRFTHLPSSSVARMCERGSMAAELLITLMLPNALCGFINKIQNILTCVISSLHIITPPIIPCGKWSHLDHSQALQCPQAHLLDCVLVWLHALGDAYIDIGGN